MALSGYKQQIRERLVADGWEHCESVELGEWWSDECWRIVAVKQCWGLEMFVTFLIDPQWEGANTGEHSPVWAIVATETVPVSWTVKSPAAMLSMTKRKFEPKLDKFIVDLASFRDTQEQLSELLEPWTSTGVSEELADELSRETATGHPLHGLVVRALVRREDNDDVLFAVTDGPAPFAVVHLTWSGKTEPSDWPSCRAYDSLSSWKRDCMQPDHDESVG